MPSSACRLCTASAWATLCASTAPCIQNALMPITCAMQFAFQSQQTFQPWLDCVG